MKVISVEKLPIRLEQHDISTRTDTFYLKVGNSTCLIHNSPATVFGRDESGQFFLTDKSGYSAKRYNGKATSAAELSQVFMNRSPVLDNDRKQFISSMSSIFDLYKRATPKNFRGVLAGDLLYYRTPPVEDGKFVFQPNAVIYKVPQDSTLGHRIAQSQTGIVVHNYIGTQYNNVADAIKQIAGPDVLVVPPVHVTQPLSISMSQVDKIAALGKKYATEINSLFVPANIKGIADIHVLFYRYINNKVDVGLADLGADFSNWLNTQSITTEKQKRIEAFLQAHKAGVNALWVVIKSIMTLKDRIVAEFDAALPINIEQYIDGQPGGEGYVVSHPKGAVKLVSRHTFTAANRALHR